MSLRDEQEILRLRDVAQDADAETPFVCRQCGGDMRFVRGHNRTGFSVIPHFAHITECTSTYASHPESREHIAAKAYIAQHITDRAPEYRDARCEIEYRIPEIKRIADVAFIFPDGEVVIHEIQLSPISLQVVQERTRDYASIGAHVVWHLGPKMQQHAGWCKEVIGVVGLLDFHTQESRTVLADRSPIY